MIKASLWWQIKYKRNYFSGLSQSPGRRLKTIPMSRLWTAHQPGRFHESAIQFWNFFPWLMLFSSCIWLRNIARQPSDLSGLFSGICCCMSPGHPAEFDHRIVCSEFPGYRELFRESGIWHVVAFLIKRYPERSGFRIIFLPPQTQKSHPMGGFFT